MASSKKVIKTSYTYDDGRHKLMLRPILDHYVDGVPAILLWPCDRYGHLLTDRCWKVMTVDADAGEGTVVLDADAIGAKLLVDIYASGLFGYEGDDMDVDGRLCPIATVDEEWLQALPDFLCEDEIESIMADEVIHIG